MKIEADVSMAARAIALYRDQFEFEIRGGYVKMLGVLGGQVGSAQLDFLADFGEELSHFEKKLEGREIKPEFQRIVAATNKAFDRLFDKLEALTDEVIMKAQQRSDGTDYLFLAEGAPRCWPGICGCGIRDATGGYQFSERVRYIVDNTFFRSVIVEIIAHRILPWVLLLGAVYCGYRAVEAARPPEASVGVDLTKKAGDQSGSTRRLTRPSRSSEPPTISVTLAKDWPGEPPRNPQTST